MSFLRLPNLRPAAFALGTVLLVASCQNLPHIAGEGVTVQAQANLESADPNEIVVAPLMVGEGVRVEDRMLREAFVAGLIERHYAPLSLDYVDQSLQEPAGADAGTMEASYMRGVLEEDAVLQVVVHEWDESLWNARKAIQAHVEVRLEDPAGGPSFWVATFHGRRDFTNREAHHATAGGLRREALGEIAREILSQLPERVATPGPNTRR